MIQERRIQLGLGIKIWNAIISHYNSAKRKYSGVHKNLALLYCKPTALVSDSRHYEKNRKE
jgi:hypothetical protein